MISMNQIEKRKPITLYAHACCSFFVRLLLMQVISTGRAVRAGRVPEWYTELFSKQLKH